jgi:hypothetical protein
MIFGEYGLPYHSNKVTFKIREDLRGFWVTREAGREEEYTDKNL